MGQLEAARAEVMHRRNGLDGDTAFGVKLDIAQQAMFARLGERDGDSVSSRASRAADAVNVGVRR